MASPDETDDQESLSVGRHGPLSLRALHSSPFYIFCRAPESLTTQFLARLQGEVHRQSPHAPAAEIIVLQLAFENANKNCKQALGAIRATEDLGNYIRACQDIRTASYKSSVLAQAMLSLTKETKTNNTQCFHSGKAGHIRKQCATLAKSGGTVPPPQGEICDQPWVFPVSVKGN